MKRIAILLVALAVIAMITTAGAQSQNQVSTSLAAPTAPSTVSTQDGKTIMTGANLGIRVDGNSGGKVLGTLMVKIGNEWREVSLANPAAE